MSGPLLRLSVASRSDDSGGHGLLVRLDVAVAAQERGHDRVVGARPPAQRGDDHPRGLLDQLPGRRRDRGGYGCAEVVQRPGAGRRPGDVLGLGRADRRHPEHEIGGHEDVRCAGAHEHRAFATPAGRGLVGEGAAMLVVEQAGDADQLGDGEQGC